MIRPLGHSLLALSVIAVLTAASAQAQTQSPSRSQHTPIDSLMGLFGQEAQAQPLNSREIESEGLPPPGFATPNGGSPPVGHQFGDQAPVQIAPAPAAAPAPQADAIRPPAPVGGGPSAAPPAIPSTSVMALPPDEQPEQGQPKELAPNLKKQLVDYTTKEPVGTIIVDTANTYLYLVLGGGKALRYGVRVGRDGFTWAGTERISRMKEWPDWFPPSEMIERQPYLPRFVAGGPGNPLGARSMYLGGTVYRIHGTNDPTTIGKHVSSGCIRLTNDDVSDLYSRVQVGAKVIVLPQAAPVHTAQAQPASSSYAPMTQSRAKLTWSAIR